LLAGMAFAGAPIAKALLTGKLMRMQSAIF